MVVLSMRIVHRLALVLWSRLVFDDRAIFDVESAGAGYADSSRRAGSLRLLGAFTRRLAGAETSTDVRNRHVGAMTVPGTLETREGSRLWASASSSSQLSVR